MKHVLSYTYVLSVFFARGKDELISRGTWFLVASEIFFLVTSLALFVITRFDYKMPIELLTVFYLVIWYICFYRLKSWINKNIDQLLADPSYLFPKQNSINVLIGFLIFSGCVLFFWLVAYVTFEGYLVK
jgi:preprotein translocase subunit SecG